MGTVVIRLPRSVTLVSGDTTFSVAAGRVMRPKEIVVRLPAAGSADVSAMLVVGDASNNDRVEARLQLEADAGHVESSTSELVRTETSIHGHRYRYGGFWLVPMEPDEEYSAAEFSRTGVKPEPIEAIVAHCLQCTTARDTVTFVAVVDRAGKVIQARPLKVSATTEATKVAAEQLAKTRFRPARYGNKTITDWVHVKVAVISGR